MRCPMEPVFFVLLGNYVVVSKVKSPFFFHQATKDPTVYLLSYQRHGTIDVSEHHLEFVFEILMNCTNVNQRID